MDAPRREYQERYRRENSERLLEQKRIYYQANRERILARIRADSERKQAYDREYHRRTREKNRTRIRAYQRKYRSDTTRHIAHNLRNRLSKFIKKRSGRSSTESLLGCTFEEFRNYIEAQFIRGINWKNYGSHWHLDHIIPVTAFDLGNPEHLKRCFHFSNLRPLPARENLSKGSKITDPQLRLTL
jgi:hypothetical protein